MDNLLAVAESLRDLVDEQIKLVYPDASYSAIVVDHHNNYSYGITCTVRYRFGRKPPSAHSHSTFVPDKSATIYIDKDIFVFRSEAFIYNNPDSIPVFKKALENWLRSPHIV
jgi:hypothetical protein